jgi:hypothetical protein
MADGPTCSPRCSEPLDQIDSSSLSEADAVSFQWQESIGHRAPQAPLIIVSGLPRAGTSMLMQMLEAGGIPVLTDAVRPPDVSNPRGYYELQRVKWLHTEVDKSWLADGKGKALKIISFLLTQLPDVYRYQVIFMQRSLREIFASQNRMLDELGQQRGNATEDHLLRYYETHLVNVRSFLASRTCFATLGVNYGDVLSQPLEEAVRIGGFLGRQLDTLRMAGVVEARLYRNRCE